MLGLDGNRAPTRHLGLLGGDELRARGARLRLPIARRADHPLRQSATFKSKVALDLARSIYQSWHCGSDIARDTIAPFAYFPNQVLRRKAVPSTNTVPPTETPIRAITCATKPEADLEERMRRVETCLLSLAGRSKSRDEVGNEDAAREYQLAVASLTELIHHTEFRENEADLVPLTEMAIRALKADPPNLLIANDLIVEIEGRLFMRSEIMKYPFLPRWKLKASTQRVGAVDIVTNALPLSFSMFIIVIGGLLVSKLLLEKCALNRVSVCELANGFVSEAYVIATIWGFFGGLASVMFRSVTTERLRMNQLRGLYYTTIYKPWLGSMFAVIVYFGVTANIIPITTTLSKGSVAEMCFWAILGFAAGFGERIVPDLVTKLEGSISSSSGK
jgi:hypothetical protein